LFNYLFAAVANVKFAVGWKT